jgi:hypothetical protein
LQGSHGKSSEYVKLRITQSPLARDVVSWLNLKNQLQTELDLTGSVGVGVWLEAGWSAVLSRENIDSNDFTSLQELSRMFTKPSCVICPLVVAVKQVERFRQEFQFDTIPRQKMAAQPDIGGRAIGSDKRITRKFG